MKERIKGEQSLSVGYSSSLTLTCALFALDSVVGGSGIRSGRLLGRPFLKGVADTSTLAGALEWTRNTLRLAREPLRVSQEEPLLVLRTEAWIGMTGLLSRSPPDLMKAEEDGWMLHNSNTFF